MPEIPQRKKVFGVDRTKLEYPVTPMGSKLSSATFLEYFCVILQGVFPSQLPVWRRMQGFFSCNQNLFLINYIHRRNVLCAQRNMG